MVVAVVAVEAATSGSVSTSVPPQAESTTAHMASTMSISFIDTR
jgi:hypothetical protein